MNALLKEIQRKVVPILKKAGVKHSAIFGSQVRGEAREDSDVDLLIDFPADKDAFDLIRLELDLENALGKKVDLVEYHRLKPLIKQYVLDEQVEIL